MKNVKCFLVLTVLILLGCTSNSKFKTEFEKENKLSINLQFIHDEIAAVAYISLAEPVKEISFLLNASLIITQIESGVNPAAWNIVDTVIPEFRVLSNKIIVSAEDYFSELSITYHGPLNDPFNVITDEIKALSWYFVWYPQELPFDDGISDITKPFDAFFDEVIIENAADLFVVKGRLDRDQKTWRYGGEGYDPFNIIAYSQNILKTSSSAYMNVYYIDPDLAEQSELAQATYRSIAEYYNGSLFAEREIPILDVAVVSPVIPWPGAYRRQDLMFASRLGNSEIAMAYLFAHETAHIWCNGADIFTWEDWLNETTAEWAGLLYFLEIGNPVVPQADYPIFEYLINYVHLSAVNNNNFPPIKTLDGSRPEGVHNKGTLLFYSIYEKHGKEVIEKLVRGFSELEEKTTEQFLEMVRIEIGSGIAEEIRNGLYS